MTADPRQLYAEGRLDEAIEAANARVKAKPTDRDVRGFLVELLCLRGHFDRADKLLEVLSNQDLDAAVTLALFRQLVRAEQARQQFYREGRVPEFLDGAPPLLSRHLQAAVMLNDGQANDAAQLLAEAETQRPQLSGVCNGSAFDDFRDLDDLNAPFLEVLTSTGKYFWVPLDTIVSIEFEAPSRPRDLLWRQAQLSVSAGPDGAVYIPTVYPCADDAPDAVRLGRVTEWTGGDGSPVRGVGQRAFLVGDEARPIMELESLHFNEAQG
ncbi:MAG: tetratricopeptide repeat protein [Gammaproteobacteria bacterium]|nr:tetratricopeptide repeat protein [Gammaproteobacteria bacterium]